MKDTLFKSDQEARTLALNIHESFIVQAPAGSGKTELLIQRFLALLGASRHPDEIIAVTFTKKAANEMRIRVLQALKMAELGQRPTASHHLKTFELAKAALQRDQHFGWHILKNPNQLRIQTIDALCAFLTKQLPLLANFGAKPELVLEPTTLYQYAVQEVLGYLDQDCPWQQTLEKLLLHLDNDAQKLETLLITLLGRRDQWLGYLHLETEAPEIRSLLEDVLTNVANETLVKLDELIGPYQKSLWLDVLNYAATHASSENQSLKECLGINRFPKPHAEYIHVWRALASLVLTKTMTWRKRLSKDIGFIAAKYLKTPAERSDQEGAKEKLFELITNFTDSEEIHACLKELFLLPDTTYKDTQWDILKSLLKILKVTAAQLKVVFELYGQIDFIENMTGALQALGAFDAPSDLALALDYQIQHLLVDEFQDTSFLQFHLLEKLTLGWTPQDGKTLFVVGDPMQSIYRFREAEVSLFLRMMQEGINDVPLTPLRLSKNFRSNAGIVEWNNTQFQNIFPSRDDLHHGAVSYASSQSAQPNESPQCVFMNGILNGTDTHVANSVIQSIQSLQLENAQESIAILVRSRSHLKEIIKKLHHYHIPFTAVEIDALAQKIHVQDILSLTLALTHLHDRTSWLAVLRAPWCGLSLSDLYQLGTSQGKNSIFTSLQDDALLAKLSEDGQNRLHRVRPILIQAVLQRYRAPLRTWVEKTYLALGGPATLKHEDNYLDIQVFLNLLTSLDKHVILRRPTLEKQLARLYAPTTKQRTAIQVMTIHSSKGLEFDHVILPHLEKQPKAQEARLMLWMERQFASNKKGLLLAPIHTTGGERDPIYNYIHEKNKLKDHFEMDRVLYVASTRAKKTLHLHFSIPQRENEVLKPRPNSFLDKFWPSIVHDPNLKLFAEDLKETPEQVEKRLVSRLATNWQNPYCLPINIESKLHQQKSGIAEMDRLPQIIGTVTHRLLYHIAEVGFHWWQDATDNTLDQRLKILLLQQSLHPDDLSQTTAKIKNLIETTINDKKGQWILKKHACAASEYAFSLSGETSVKQYIIDRTFVDEGNMRWIIDYKTTIFDQQDLQQFLQNEQKKYAAKMQRYAECLRPLENRKIKFALYFPAIPAWQEWSV